MTRTTTRAKPPKGGLPVDAGTDEPPKERDQIMVWRLALLFLLLKGDPWPGYRECKHHYSLIAGQTSPCGCQG